MNPFETVSELREDLAELWAIVNTAVTSRVRESRPGSVDEERALKWRLLLGALLLRKPAGGYASAKEAAAAVRERLRAFNMGLYRRVLEELEEPKVPVQEGEEEVHAHPVDQLPEPPVVEYLDPCCPDRLPFPALP